jgi:glutamate dehydrogenase (NADP+)
MIKHVEGESAGWKGKRVLLSGSGNVAQYAAQKVMELGGTVLTLSDSKGTLVCEEGFTNEDIDAIGPLKVAHGTLSDYYKKNESRFKYHDGKRPWTLFENADVALPSATQNEISCASSFFCLRLFVLARVLIPSSASFLSIAQS